jgi:hypothetical protein
MAIINEFRLSFVFTEVFDDMLLDPDGKPLGLMARTGTYVGALDKLIAGDTPLLTIPVSLPWEADGGKSFWTLYLGPASSSLTGNKAWKNVIPLRLAAPAALEVPGLKGRLTTEALFYPHGISFLVTATCLGEMQPDEVVEAASALYRDQKYSVRWTDNTKEDLKLATLGERALLKLRTMAIGAAIPHAPYRPDRVFSVATVIRGQGVDVAVDVVDGDNSHRMLEGLTAWNPNWSQQPPPLLANHKLPMDNPAPGNVLYSQRRGRAAWVPSRFLPKKSNKPYMSCYHRNLTLASAQLESLSALCWIASSAQAGGKPPVGAYYDLCKRAAEVLGRLYGGVRSTYRSASLRRQVEDNQWVAPINEVRKMCQLGVLN